MSALDFGARALAAQLAQRIAQEKPRARLRRLMAAARIANASDLPALSAPPVVTSLGGTGTGGLTQSFTVSANPALFTLHGGLPIVYGSAWQIWSASYPSGGNTSATTYGHGGRIAFRTDAPSFDIGLLADNARVRILIDGQYADKIGALNTVNAGSYALTRYNVAMPGGTARRLRRIDVEFEKSGGFADLRVAPGDSVQPVATAERYRIGVLGDSISAATGVARVNDGWAFHAARRLGGMDIDLVSFGIGGTGYVAAGSVWPFGAHVADVSNQPLDEVWIAGGCNDVNFTAAQIKAAALALFQAVRLRCPNLPIIVFGAFVSAGNGAVTLACESAIKAAFDQWADPASAFVPFQAASPALQTGYLAGTATGSVSATTLTVTAATATLAVGRVLMGAAGPLGTIAALGSGTGGAGSYTLTLAAGQAAPSGTVTLGVVVAGVGNFQYYGGGLDGTDSTHPNAAGHDYIGAYVAEARRQIAL